MGWHAIGIDSSLKSNLNDLYHVRYNVAPSTRGASSNKPVRFHQVSSVKRLSCRSLRRVYALPVGLKDQSSSGSLDFQNDEADSADQLAKPLGNDELKALFADSERAKVLKKLSEANQHNRFLKRQLQGKEDALTHFKTELAVVEQEIQALVALANEVAIAGFPEGTRKIHGKFIHSHLLSRLEAVQEKLHEQVKGVNAAQSKEVVIFWIGMAQSVQVMGSFNSWSEGEYLSPEYTDSFTKFSTTLFLRPGRYEIKFLVDGEWNMSPELPIVGEGLTENNLLIVE